MTMRWNNKEEHNESMRKFRKSHVGNLEVETLEEEPFEEHADYMRIFRKSHPNDLEVKVSRRDLINTMWQPLVIDTVRETGGSTGPAGMMDWSVFVPIGEVTTRRFSSN